MGSIGVAELAVLVVVVGIISVAIGLGIWMFTTVRGIRRGQQAIQERLDSMERRRQR